jgi:hypothetical protein
LTGIEDKHILFSRGRFMCNRRWAFSISAVIALGVAATAQSVISTRSGVIHFFEGTVYVGNEPLEAHLGKFPILPQGGELRTELGRVEVLLTPGVFLRLGQQSAIRMVANSLADTQVELVTGSAIVESGESNAGTSVTVMYKDWRVHFLQKGSYRIDSDPPRLWVLQGEAEVMAGANGEPLSVEQGKNLPLASVLVPESTNTKPEDALNDWATGRNQSISADNAITAQIDEDPDARTAGDADAFTYFPMVGAPYIPPGSALYSAYSPYQPGFSSIYLPGYTYRPLIIGLLGNGVRGYTLSRPRQIYVSPGAGGYVGVPRAPLSRPGTYTYTPLPRPTFVSRPAITTPLPRPVSGRVAPSVGVHGGAHR